MMSRRSRKSTEAEDTIIATPATKSVCSNISSGTTRMVECRAMSPCHAKASVATSRTGIASAKCTRCDRTTTSGKASAGNITFLISPAFALIEVVDSRTAAEKKVHGRMPAKRNSGYGLTEFAGKKMVKTTV